MKSFKNFLTEDAMINEASGGELAALIKDVAKQTRTDATILALYYAPRFEEDDLEDMEILENTLYEMAEDITEDVEGFLRSLIKANKTPRQLVNDIMKK